MSKNKDEKLFTRRRLFGLAANAGIFGGIYCLAPRVLESQGRNLGLCRTSGASRFLARPASFTRALPTHQTLKRIYENKQFTLFGDTDHSNVSYDQFFWSREHINTLVNAGVKHLCLETTNQSRINKITSGEMSAEEYGRFFANNLAMWHTPEEAYIHGIQVALGMQYAFAKGLKLHAVDYISPEEMEARRRGNFAENNRLLSRFKTRMCGADSTLTDGVYTSYTFTHLHRIIPASLDSVTILASRDDDTQRTENIKNSVGNERTVIMFGNGHFDNIDTSIKSLIGEENVTHIQFNANLRDYDEALGPEYAEYQTGREKTPDFIYSIEDEAVYATPVNRFPELATPLRPSRRDQNRRATPIP